MIDKARLDDYLYATLLPSPLERVDGIRSAWESMTREEREVLSLGWRWCPLTERWGWQPPNTPEPPAG